MVIESVMLVALDVGLGIGFAVISKCNKFLLSPNESVVCQYSLILADIQPAPPVTLIAPFEVSWQSIVTVLVPPISSNKTVFWSTSSL